MAKQRAIALLQTISDELMVKDACAELAISRTRYQQLREQGLEAWLGAMHFGRPGRPAKSQSPATAEEVAALRAEIARLERELAMARAQAELAATGLRGTEALRGELLAARARLTGRSARRR